MLCLLSPAKALDYERPVPPELNAAATLPTFVDEATALIEVLKPYSPAQVASLMTLSDPLAQLNVARYQLWQREFTPDNSRPAVLAFNGDVYEGLNAASLSLAQLRWAQAHVLILSGLYGVLRPLDRLQPYRLEMGTRLATPGAKDLYRFWGERPAAFINAQQAQQAQPVVVNLASQEYFKAVQRKVLRARVVDCVFEDNKAGQWKVISFHAKRARGLMARHLITEQIDRPEGLDHFQAEGWALDASASTADKRVFRRRLA
jgi:cytoplasmic iron level regulating protein YaaA (DUF328/UPF0246 family)